MKTNIDIQTLGISSENITNVRGDGSCFFYALQTSILGNGATKKECESFGTFLRRETIEYLTLHPELLTETAIQSFAADKVDYNLSEASSSLIEMQRIFDDITTHYGRQQTYADNFIVQLVAKILKANIVILREDQDLVVTFPDEASSLTYYLYLKDEHYQSISLPSDQVTTLEVLATDCIINSRGSIFLQHNAQEHDLDIANQILSDEALAKSLAGQGAIETF
jgi:hypothetical protein